ncbi:MAG: anti-sigma factor [Planctomycetes bacterium]|nr:anti-sigma factor [Planctomycetota bacterium]MBL7044936.1 anti-sigma factor [Pirellulaceae bacterium]
MKATSNTSEPSRDDALTRKLVLLADRQEIQPPTDVLDRVRARLHENTVRSPSAAPARTTASWTKRVWFAGVGAAAVVLIALFFSMQPSTIAWSQVVEAVRAVPWIHVKEAGEGRSAEAWFSFSQDVAAYRCDSMVQFDDFRSGIRYEYDSEKKKLYRLSVGDGAAKDFELKGGLFQAIFRGDAIREGVFLPRFRIVKQQQRTVTERGRRWILYELELQLESGGPESPTEIPTAVVEIRVDPEKMLPHSATHIEGEVMKVEAAFDYPNEGPADIYALGIPRDTPVEDRMPPAELERIIKIVEQNRHEFDNYLAVSGDNSREATNIYIVRRKGEKLCVDTCGMEQYIQRDGEKERVGKSVDVSSSADLKNWWREYGEEIKTSGVLRRLNRREIDAGRYRVESLAYPRSFTHNLQQMASSSLVTAQLDPKGQDGPAGSVRVELLYSHQGAPNDRMLLRKEEYWLQPKYGYAVVRHVLHFLSKVGDDAARNIFEYDDFRQTPTGIWYPTVSRWKHSSWPPNKNKPGGLELHGEVRYFYLDFTAELPDELFSPG